MRKIKVLGTLVLAGFLLIRCSRKDATASLPDGLSALPLSITSPIDNPQTNARIGLGRQLFWDPILSGNKDVACASCHHPSLGYGDGLDLSIGVNGVGLGSTRHFISPNTIPFARRNAMGIVNTAFNSEGKDGICNPVTAAMFFDSRTQSLEAQSLEPLKTLEEMRGADINSTAILDTVIFRLKNNPQYVQGFAQAFGGSDPVNSQNLGKAIASFERTLIANHSPFDEYARGNTSALSATQIQGMQAFVKNGCNNCHNGPMFSDYQLHVLGVPDNAKQGTDGGANGAYQFRTPSLRNLTYTAPYMHSGVFPTLQAVLNFYGPAGDRHSQNPHVGDAQMDSQLHHLDRGDINAILSFLEALNDKGFDQTIPASVPSGLKPGGNIQ